MGGAKPGCPNHLYRGFSVQSIWFTANALIKTYTEYLTHPRVSLAEREGSGHRSNDIDVDGTHRACSRSWLELKSPTSTNCKY